jgi:hypothetical protein
VKSHNFSLHVTAISYNIYFINRFTTINRAVGLMDKAPLHVIQCTGSSLHNCGLRF